MTALIIIAAIIILITALLFLPASLFLSFNGDFSVKIKLGGICVFNSDNTKPENVKHEKDTKPEAENKKADSGEKQNLFTALKAKLGFTGAVKEILYTVKSALVKIKKQLKKITVKRLTVDISIASDNAAKTAVEYGAVCAAVYPLLSFLESVANIGIKQINVSSDFNSQKPHFSFSAVVRLRIIYLIIAAFAAFCEYNKFKTRNEL